MARPRLVQTELLDQNAGTLADVRANLDDMWRLNRLTGGLSALMTHLGPRLRAPGPLTLVDVGSGSGQLARYLSRWSAGRAQRLTIYAVDYASRHLTLAREVVREAGIHLIQADAEALPFAPGAVDYYISTLFLHHLEPDALVQLLRQSFQRARRGLVMSDLTRDALSEIGFRLIQPVAAPHPMTLHDGLVSIRRAYTPDELLALAYEAGLTGAHVYRHPLWRMTLVVDKA